MEALRILITVVLNSGFDNYSIPTIAESDLMIALSLKQLLPFSMLCKIDVMD
jgi:hypothetical protein